MGLTVTMLAYHEAENLKWFLPELKKVIDSLNIDSVEYLVIDSAEPTDDTAEVCQAFGARCIPQEEPGYGGAYRTAIRYAREDMFLILDADASQDYTQIPKMYQEFIAGADVVIGSRYIPGGKTDDAKTSQVMSRVLNLGFRMAIGVNVHDFSDSLRIYGTNDLRQLHLTCENFDISEELILKLKLLKNNAITIKEVPIAFKKRIMGESKRSLLKFIVCFGQMLVFSIVLRALACGQYDAQKHDAKAWSITGIILYIGIGFLATVINVSVYLLFARCINYLIANLIAWMIAVLFAFVLNKIIAFNNWDWKAETVRHELVEFTGARLVSGILDMLMIWLMIGVISLNGTVSKIIDSFIVIMLDCVFSRCFIFRKCQDRGGI